MFRMISSIFSFLYYLIYVLIWLLNVSFNLVTLLSFLYLVYMCILKTHHLCQIIAQMKHSSQESSRHHSEYQDDVQPDDSVSVVFQYSTKDSDSNGDESAFENIDSNQV